MKLLIPPPLIALISGLSMWGVASNIDVLRLIFPFQHVLAYALIGSGLLIDISAIFAFRSAKTTVTPLAPEKASALVISGLYRVTRNPMYLGLLLILTGVALLLGSLLNAAIIIAFMAYITAFQIKPEEEKLTEIFGAQYLSYMQKVRRWI